MRIAKSKNTLTNAIIKPMGTGFFVTIGRKNKFFDRKEKQVFIRDNKKCLIYEGIKPLLPDSITRRYISDNMYELLNSDVVFPAILDYYKEKPLLDTIQR